MQVDTTASATLIRLAPISATLYGAMQEGIEHANVYFEERGWTSDFEPWLYSHLVRTTARQKLRAAGLSAVEEAGIAEPAMSSLVVQFGQDVIKIRKSGDGLVPMPIGKSSQRHYEQIPMLPGAEETNNLVLLWNESNGMLEPMSLARPNGSAVRRRDLEMHWNVSFPADHADDLVEDLNELARLTPRTASSEAS